MDARPLLVGEQNPYSDDPEFDLYPLPDNATGGRLAALLGLTRGQYLHLFRRRNLLHRGEEWGAKASKQRAAELAAVDRGPFVLLGRKVATAFGLGRADFFSSGSLTTGQRYFVVPHPSGLCREWNDPAAESKLREAVLEAYSGEAEEFLAELRRSFRLRGGAESGG